MRRRVGRVLRIGLFVIGLLLVTWLPLSIFLGAYTGDLCSGSNVFRISSYSGGVRFVYLPGNTNPLPAFQEEGGGIGRQTGVNWRSAIRSAVWFDSTLAGRPWRAGFGGMILWIPLWLLAFICLAWPVTSFMIARRKPKRGYPVVPRAGGEAVSPPASSS